MNHQGYRCGVAVLVLGLVAIGGLAAPAADTKKAKTTVTGEITKLEAMKITVNAKDYDVTNAKVTIDGNKQTTNDLKVGMRVKLTLEGDKVTEIEGNKAPGKTEKPAKPAKPGK
jgi:predicted nicotinamide N-methyase